MCLQTHKKREKREEWTKSGCNSVVESQPEAIREEKIESLPSSTISD